MSGAEWDGKMSEGDMPIVETTVTLAKAVFVECPGCNAVNRAIGDDWHNAPDDTWAQCGECNFSFHKSEWRDVSDIQE